MTLNSNAPELIRANLKQIASGKKARAVVIGCLSEEQLQALNKERRKRGLPEVKSGEVVFLGGHIHRRRIEEDGYTIEDVIVQITTAMGGTRCKSATAIESADLRDDGYGNKVRDRAVFECTSRYPRLALFSVIPGGDTNKPKSEAEKKRTASLRSA